MFSLNNSVITLQELISENLKLPIHSNKVT